MLDVDVTDDASLDHAFDYLSTHWGNLDFLVHALAFSDKTELTGRLSTPAGRISKTLWTSLPIL